MLMRKLRKGQAELVGGLIVVSVLILIVLPLLINMMTTSTIVVTRIYSTRSQFEIDRWSEKLQLINDSYGTYRLVNVGPVTLEIVRVWYANGSLVEFTPWKVVAVGGSLPITELGVNDPKDVDRIVTSRGRIFKMIELIPPPAPSAPAAPTLLEALAKNITLGYYLVSRYNGTYGIVARYFDDRGWKNVSVAYHNGTYWLVFNGTTCTWRVGSVDENKSLADLDNNNIMELVLVDGNKIAKGEGKLVFINITLYRCDGRGFITITNNTELVMVYFKLVSVYKEEEIYVNATIVFNEVGGTRNYSSTATFSYAKVGGIGSTGTVKAIYQGYTIFPLKGFVTRHGVEGSYDMSLLISIYSNDSSFYTFVNTEYIAVVTYP